MKYLIKLKNSIQYIFFLIIHYILNVVISLKVTILYINRQLHISYKNLIFYRLLTIKDFVTTKY